MDFKKLSPYLFQFLCYAILFQPREVRTLEDWTSTLKS